MRELPFTVVHELPGWTLFWALVETAPHSPEDREGLLRRCEARARERFDLETLVGEAAIAEMRALFRRTGTDPTRYRPSSEALLRRLLKGSALPRIHPLVDLSNCLSTELAVPCCVMDDRSIEPPFTLRAGRPGERYESLKGPFNLERRPLLVDVRGPCDTPISGNRRVEVRGDTLRTWLVAYLPASALAPREADRRLRDLLDSAPLATILRSGCSG